LQGYCTELYVLFWEAPGNVAVWKPEWQVHKASHYGSKQQ